VADLAALTVAGMCSLLPYRVGPDQLAVRRRTVREAMRPNWTGAAAQWLVPDAGASFIRSRARPCLSRVTPQLRFSPPPPPVVWFARTKAVDPAGESRPTRRASQAERAIALSIS